MRALTPLGATGPITANTAATMGKINRYNATAGNLAAALPALSAWNVGDNLVVEKDTLDGSANTITLSRAGSDVFDDGTTSVVLSATGQKLHLQVVQPASTKLWKVIGGYNPGGGGGGGSATWGTLSGKPAVIAAGADQASARAVLGLDNVSVRTGTRKSAAIPVAGRTALGVGCANVTTDLDAFLTASQQTQISTYMTFMLDNGTFAAALADIAAVNARFGTVVPLELAWSHPGATNLAGIAAGSDDAYIIARAKEIQAYGGPVMLRWNWEFNGDWYPWASHTSGGAVITGNAPSDYIAAWRRVYDLVTQIAPNASFVWCPHLWTYYATPSVTWYPGDAYVDWVGVTCYPGSADWSYIETGAGGLTEMAAFAVAHGKPMRFCEWGVGQGGSGSNVGIFYQMKVWVDANPIVRELIYFHMNGLNGVNYRLGAYADWQYAYQTNYANTPARYPQSSPGGYRLLSKKVEAVTYAGSVSTARPLVDVVYWVNYPSTPTNAQPQDIIEGVGITKADVGLGNVDNTADSAKAVLSATKLTTARLIDGQTFDGSANVTIIAPGTNAATAKTTPVDADLIPLVDSAASNVLKKLTFANLKAWFKSYYDSVATTLTNKTISGANNTLSAIGLGSLSTTGTASSTTYLRGDGSWATPPTGGGGGGGDALVANPLSQFAATTSAQLRGVLSDETGAGAAVFANSPALVTPTGIVKADVGLNLVDNTADNTKAVLSAAKLTTPRNINGVPFDGSADINPVSAKTVGLGWYRPGYISGQYYFCNSSPAATTSSSLGNGTARVTPWIVTDSVTATRVFADFTVAGEANSVLRIGIWADDGTGRPGTLVLDAGTISTGSGNAGSVATGGTPGCYEITISQALAPGLYWVGGVVQSAPTTQPTVRCTFNGAVPVLPALGSTLPATGLVGIGYAHSGMSGALANMTSPFISGIAGPRLGFKAA